MNNLNSIILEGNLVRDPESKTTQSGSNVCRMQIATNRYYRKGEERVKEVMYIYLESWGNTALVCEEYLKKGSWVRAVGRLRQDRWKNPEGQNRERYVLVAEHVEFRSPLKKSEETSETSASVAAETKKSLEAEATG